MSIWGKVIGGTAGFALGGPLGAIIGGLAGHAFDRMRGEGRAAEDADAANGTKQIAFTIGVIVLGAKMAKADGVVTADEIAAFKDVFHVPPAEMEHVAKVFDRARRDSEGFEPYARQIAKLFRENPAVLEDLMDGLFHIAKADNVIHPNELNFLQRVGEIFGFDEHEFARIRASHLGPDAADPYQILGVPHDISDAELKKSYRALIREHHPDRLMAEGMPQEFVDVANSKLATINDAYDRVETQRGMK